MMQTVHDGQPEAAYRVNGQLVPRARFYELACDPARSVVVEACAGAGKTWMLVSRILRALLDGVRPQDIVSITFTRKAAGEMRQRLNEWLLEFAQANEAARVQALIDRGMSLPQAQASASRLAGLQQELLEAGRQVEIRTFHAWFSQLLRAAPLDLLREMGLSPELQLLEDEDELMPDLWRSFHAEVLADPTLLSHYRSLSAHLGRSRLASWLTAAFTKRVELRMAHEQGVLMDSMPTFGTVTPEWRDLAHPVEAFALMRTALASLASDLGAAKGKTSQNAALALRKALDLADAQEAFEQAFKALLTDKGLPRQHLEDSDLLRQLQTQLQRLQLALQQHQAHSEHQRMCALALCLVQCFERLKHARGLVDMNDLERGALTLLANADASAWVQERLDSRVRQLLIDEFQDTSPLQWHALHGWLAAYAGAGGGVSGQSAPAVFIVGDPKQSIYRFRRAEPRVFAAARDFLVQALGADVLACDHTRRNALGILQRVNEVFLQAQLAQQYEDFRAHSTEVATEAKACDPLEGVFALSDVQAVAEAGAEAQGEDPVWRPSLTQARHEIEAHRRSAEARQMAQAIASLIRDAQVPAGEVFVLARKREPLRVLAAELKARGIAHVAPEDADLLEQPDVRDLIAVLDVLASPGHDLSLAQALRSPALDVPDDDLVALAICAGRWRARRVDAPASPLDGDAPAPEGGWWRALMQGDAESVAALEGESSQGADAPISAPLVAAQVWASRPALARARAWFLRWRELAASSTPHDLLSQVLHDASWLQSMARCVPASELRSRQAAVHALLATALDLDGGRYTSIYGFVRAVKRRSLKVSWPAEPDAVQLLTVHGAKGLEARVVFIMDADAGPAKAETSTLLVDWPVEAGAPRRVAFLSSESKPPPALADLMADEVAQRRREELNALYVAMTRAKVRLVLSRTLASRRPSAATWWSRLSDGLPVCSPQTLVDSDSGQQAPSTTSLMRLPVLRCKPLPPSLPPAPADESAAIGEAMHRVLEWVSGPQGRGQSLDALLGAAAQMYGLDARRSERMQHSVRAILGSAECAPFMDSASCQWAGNEVAVSWAGKDMRMDRLVRREGTWWVLDYKLNAAPDRDPEYLAQMAAYVRAVRALQPGESVRAAFITGEGRLLDCTSKLSFEDEVEA